MPLTEHDNEDTSVARIAFKAPIFWEHDPELWFFQVESQFVMANITVDSTKFHAVIAALSSNVLSCIRDLIKSPPSTDAYKALKDRVLQHFARSDSSRLNLLLKDLQLGDKRPSFLLNEMRNLAPEKLDDDILQSLWLQRLPTNLQQILAVCKVPLDELAQIADKAHEVSASNSAVAAVGYSESELNSLKTEVAELKTLVKNLSTIQIPSRSRRLTRGRSGNRHRSNSVAKNTAKDFCWYHRRFGDKATKCVKPCAWAVN